MGELVTTQPQMLAPQQNQSAGMEIENRRAVAEVQAFVVGARAAPRDIIKNEQLIQRECQRYNLASQAEYCLPIGGSSVKGPSIRLMEVIAQNWGNIHYGVKELQTANDEEGRFTDCEASAWDAERNTRFSRVFRVYHHLLVGRGDTKTKKVLRDPVEIGRLISNHGARYQRQCLQKVIPAYVVETSLQLCRQTLIKGEGAKPLTDRTKEMIRAFASLGVSQEDLEKYIGCKWEAFTPEHFADLTAVYRTIKDGQASTLEFFGRQDVNKGTAAEEVAAKLGVKK